ncbi:MAG: DNA-binding protein WhiA [Actinomycetota bacterium]|nr:DNA-binding protein WhiA [Actinomycetota bacterium]
MSFTTEVKNELARLMPSRRCCRLAELSALLHLEGSLHVSGRHRLYLHSESENAAVARKIFQHLKNLFDMAPQLRVEKVPRLRGHNCYSLYLVESDKTVQVLNELGLLDNSLRPVLGIPPRLTKLYCCGISYLRGAFLGGGYINHPDQPAHLEINVRHAEMAEGLCDLCASYDLNTHINRRKGLHVVYSKSRGEQVHFLTLLGAHKTVLRLESDAVVRELRERVNRRVNSETANLERSVDAAQQQLSDIRSIQNLLGMDYLPKGLREIADIRLLNPEVSLRELGQKLKPPISKSAAYHRMLRIHKIASTL